MPTAIAISSKKQGFYEKYLIRLFGKMKLGRLRLSLPDGTTTVFGNGEGGVEANMEVRHNDFFKRCILYGDIGFGEAYVEGDWDTDNISNVIRWFILNIDSAPSLSGSKTRSFALNLLKFANKLTHLRRANSMEGSRRNISAHYDLSNEFFALFLDETMTYSAAYFETSTTELKEAQIAKYDLLCREMNLQPGDHVLEIGSGWGGNAIHMAGRYGCKVTTVTISEEQYRLASQRVSAAGLSDRVSVLLQDYRLLNGTFDKIVSVEMLEAVGHQWYNTYFKKCAHLLKKDGVFALQVITCPDSRFESLKKNVDWIQKHIFPGSLLPSVAAINKAVNETSELTLVSLKDIGLHYAATLREWHKRFNNRLSEVKQLGFDEQFIRKWNYYFCICEAAFDMRNINVMQMVYSRPNNRNR